MPGGSLQVPHFRQSNPGACLPACARMALAAFGANLDESRLAEILGSYEFGTPASRITRLNTLGYKVEYKPSSLDELRQQLDIDRAAIAFVRAEFLPWADFDGLHAVVIVTIDDEHVTLHDPAQESGSTQISINGFLLAWEEFDSMAAIIWR